MQLSPEPIFLAVNHNLLQVLYLSSFLPAVAQVQPTSLAVIGKWEIALKQRERLVVSASISSEHKIFCKRLNITTFFYFFCPWEYSLVRARGRNWTVLLLTSIQFSSVPQSCLTLWEPTACSTPGFPVHHQLPELAQTHVHWVGDAIQPSHPLTSPSSSAFNLSQLQGLFQWVSSSHQVTKVLEFQLQHQSLQRIFSTDFL